MANAVSGRFIFAASESCADLLYLTRFQAPDPFLWFQVPDLNAVVMGPLELGRARHQVNPEITVLAEHDAKCRFQLSAEPRLSPHLLLSAISRQTGITHWETVQECPLGLTRKLEAAGLSVAPASPFCPGRVIKSAAEIAAIRTGVRLAEAGLAQAVAVLRDAQVTAMGLLTWQGETLTAERLRGEINAAIVRAGGIPAHTIVAPGRQGADPHQAGTGPIRVGEPLVLDIFPRVEATGYFGDLTRTVAKGRATAEVSQAFTAVRAAQAEAIATVKAGILARDVHQAAANRLETAGFTTALNAETPYGFIHGLGHGLGLEIHEEPRVNAKADKPLQAGQVITIEPGLYYPEWGGIRLEDVVVVTAEACENLTTAPIFLEIE